MTFFLLCACKVGGAGFKTVLDNMNLFGRVSVCGSIGTYNENNEVQGE